MNPLSFDDSSPTAKYQRIPDTEGQKEPCEPTTGSWFAFYQTMGLMFVTLLFFTVVWAPTTKLRHDHHEERIPTLLSLVDPESYGYVNALTNDVYEQLKSATFIHDPKEDTSEAPQLILDNYEIDVRGPLTISWTPGRDGNGRAVLKESDVFVLHCGADSIHRFNNNGPEKTADGPSLHILEAATLAQVRATARKHQARTTTSSSKPAPENEWHIPEFPVVRYEVCQFLLYRPTSENNQFYLLTASDLLHIPHAHSRPTAIHWALTASDPSSMIVNFVTGDKQTGNPVIQYQIADQNPFRSTSRVQKATGTTDTYRAEDLCHAPANLTEPGKFRPPGALHTIRVTGLQPDTLYEYQVGIAGGQGVTWSDKFIIRSPLLPGAYNFSYLVYGDQGCPETGWTAGAAMTAAMAAREVSTIRAVHHFGDLSYAMGAAHIWDEWLAMIQPVTTSVPLMISVGNHEYCYTESHKPGLDPSLPNATHGFSPAWGNMHGESGGECGVPTAKRFTMPQTNRSNGVFWYSYIQGSVYTAVLSAEHDLSPGSPQHMWLVDDLTSVNRTLTPWLIVEIHRPMYQSEANRWTENNVGIALRYEFEDVLYDFKVDLFLSGHYHSYFRTCDGLYRSKCSNGGPTHITVGSAGASLDTVGLYWNQWTAKYIKDYYGYGRITVANATALHFEFVKAGNESDSLAGKTMDDVWILRDR